MLVCIYIVQHNKQTWSCTTHTYVSFGDRESYWPEWVNYVNKADTSLHKGLKMIYKRDC